MWRSKRPPRGGDRVDAAAVKSYTTELRTHLKEAELTEGKAFLCSFVERIEVNGGEVTIRRANRRRLFDRVE